MGVEFKDNAAEVRAALTIAVRSALEAVGGTIEDRARDGIRGPKDLRVELVDSIGHVVSEDGVLRVGSNLQVAPYIELGTGPHYEPPPEWLKNNAEPGRGAAGLSHWIYYDPLEKAFKVGTPQAARPFLRPAFTEHVEEYRRVMQAALAGKK